MQVDRDLVEAARRGDREAYADLIRVRGHPLFAIAQRILRDVDRAEDALQDALVIAWRDLRGLRDPDRFDAWLYRLLVRSCIAEAQRMIRIAAGPSDFDAFMADEMPVVDSFEFDVTSLTSPS
jgi:RNA polymerase sigma-70 factor (ECF subfamily)